MSQEAFLPCFVCGKTLTNAFIESDNQPNEGTCFSTPGHYGSTFWDSIEGDELLVLNVCDPCLRQHPERLGQQKIFLPIRCAGMMGFGGQKVDRPLVPYTGNMDHTEAHVSPEELGTDLPGVRWVDDIEERKHWLEKD